MSDFSNYELTRVISRYIVLKNPMIASKTEYYSVKRLLEMDLGVPHGWENKERDQHVLVYARSFRTDNIELAKKARDLVLLTEAKIISGISLPEDLPEYQKKRKKWKESAKRRAKEKKKSAQILAFRSLMKVDGDDAA